MLDTGIGAVRVLANAAKLLGDKFDPRTFGRISMQCDGYLIILNYTAEAQYEGGWNKYEKVCRGLILNRVTGEVVACPFNRFPNWGEETTTADLVEVTEKLDGSLAILHRVDGDYRIATRGAFHSDQAEWATAFLRRYDLSKLPANYTLLFEIIYPDNRIVIDYKGTEALILIGCRDRWTGRDFPYKRFSKIAQEFGLALSTICNFTSPEEVIEIAKGLDANHEGYVMRFADGKRFKVKGDAYRAVHRILSNLTFKAILEQAANETLSIYITHIPDEFMPQVKSWETEIRETVTRTLTRVGQELADAPKSNRKEFALHILEHYPADASYLFTMLDGKDIRPLIYKMEFR